MEWYHYLANFFCGVFLINALPHLVHGISGNRFPTPFSKPRGVGLSGPVTNVIWGLVNLNFAYMASRHSNFSYEDRWSFYIFFLGVCALAIPLSIRFKKKHKEEPVTEQKESI
jgi:hypothetical protein